MFSVWFIGWFLFLIVMQETIELHSQQDSQKKDLRVTFLKLPTYAELENIFTNFISLNSRTRCKSNLFQPFLLRIREIKKLKSRSHNLASVKFKTSVKFKIMQFRPSSFPSPFFLHVCVLWKEIWRVWMITSRSGTSGSLPSGCLMPTNEKLPGIDGQFSTVRGILIRWRGGECQKWLASYIWIQQRKTFAWRSSNKNVLSAYLDLDFRCEICCNSPCCLVVSLLSANTFPSK